MTRPFSARNAILAALSDHPFLSRRQLELYLHYSSAGVRYGLRQLRTRKSIWQVNARQSGMRARALYAPTRAGIEELARQARVPLRDYLSENRFSPARLNRLVVTMQRVFQLHTTFLWLSKPAARSPSASKQGTAPPTKAAESYASQGGETLWHAAKWDADVAKLFTAKRQVVWISFHGAALMQRSPERTLSERSESKRKSKDIALSSSKDGRWAFVVVEFDSGRAPVAGERERLAHFVAAQDDPRFWGKDKEMLFPILLVIAQDELRLQEYYNLLRSAALSRQLPMPRAYVTTARGMLAVRDDPTSRVWYSTISGHQTSLLFDTEGLPGPLPTQVPWQKLPLAEPRRAGATVNLEGKDGLSEFAQVALKLTPLAKRVLDEIAAHPLLTLDELALLLKVTNRWMRPALAVMSELKLVEVHQSRYLIAPKGEQYLAQVAGYGNAVRRYTRARGWGNGFDALVRHWEHTQAENEFFLNLARVAHKRHHRMTWLSELEGRLYYEAGQRWHSFLPDGRGTYAAGQKRYEFALEVDRSRAPLKRFRGKLAEYDACVASNVLRTSGIESQSVRVLVVTNSWERAEAWRRSALEVKVRFPLFITTFDRIKASGVDAPIWLRGDIAKLERAADTPKECCFKCFADDED